MNILFDAAGWQIVDRPGAAPMVRTGRAALECTGEVLGLPLCEHGAAGPDRWQARYRTQD